MFMFRQMRRKNQQLSENEVSAILEKSTYGVLSVQGDDGYPYGVPLNYAVSHQSGLCLYFHCAKEGHKLEGLKRSKKVSFCVVCDDEVIPEKLTTAYASVVLFGTADLVRHEKEKYDALRLLTERFSPGYEKEGEEEIQKFWDSVEIIRLDVESVTGKAGQEWLKWRSAKD